MAKTTVNNIVSEVKILGDYNITDDDLTTLLLYAINKAIKRTKQQLLDNGLTQDITASTTFKLKTGQAYVDIQKAMIVGNVATFTGIANDKIKVTIDGTDYDDISIATATTIALVATAINTAVGSTVARANAEGYLEIESPTSGSSSAVTIADGTATGQTVVADLFSTSAERTKSAITDLDEILKLSERVNDRDIDIWTYDRFLSVYTDPDYSSASTPDVAARFGNYIYFGDTPSSSAFIYMDYFKLITEVTSGSTMPFDEKYDPIIVAMAIEELTKYLDRSNLQAISTCKADVKEAIDEFIVKAVKNPTMIRQSASRRETVSIQPRPAE